MMMPWLYKRRYLCIELTWFWTLPLKLSITNGRSAVLIACIFVFISRMSDYILRSVFGFSFQNNIGSLFQNNPRQDLSPNLYQWALWYLCMSFVLLAFRERKYHEETSICLEINSIAYVNPRPIHPSRASLVPQ